MLNLVVCKVTARLQRLRNAGSMEWVFALRGFTTSQVLSVQEHQLQYVQQKSPSVLAADVFRTGIFH
jgi:hypothetical protein